MQAFGVKSIDFVIQIKLHRHLLFRLHEPADWYHDDSDELLGEFVVVHHHEQADNHNHVDNKAKDDENHKGPKMPRHLIKADK